MHPDGRHAELCGSLLRLTAEHRLQHGWVDWHPGCSGRRSGSRKAASVSEVAGASGRDVSAPASIPRLVFSRTTPSRARVIGVADAPPGMRGRAP